MGIDLQLWELVKVRVPGEDDFCPGVEKVRPGNSRDIPRIFGEIFQYAQFVARFGRIVFLLTSTTGQRMDSGAAIRTSSCAP